MWEIRALMIGFFGLPGPFTAADAIREELFLRILRMRQLLMGIDALFGHTPQELTLMEEDS